MYKLPISPVISFLKNELNLHSPDIDDNLFMIQIYPEWRILDFYVVNTLQDVFLSDERESTRPMTHYAESAEGVLALFDNIAYAKCKFNFNCVLLIPKFLTFQH